MKLLVHDHVAHHISRIRPHHTASFIFYGRRSIGKATAAQELARRLNCLDHHDQTNTCSNCSKVQTGAHPDYIMVAPADKPSISIEQIRAIKEPLSLSPYHPQGARIVQIVDAHTMTTEAQNALLKLIEEPPPRTIFLLIAEELMTLLPTVRSRCAALYFPPVSEDQLAAWLTQELEISTQQATILAKISNGAPGLAVSLASNPAQAEALLKLHDLATSARQKSVFERLQLAATLASDTDKHTPLEFGVYLHRSVIELIRSDNIDSLKAAYILGAIEHYRRQLYAKVNPRVALEQLMLGLQ